MNEEWIRQDDDYYCMYFHTRLDTNVVFYIGITGQKTMRRAYDRKQRNSHWKNIYAKTKIKVDIVFTNLTKENALLAERAFISFYKRVKDGGTLCNIEAGGKVGNFPSTETRQKLRERVLGKKWTKESREKLSKAKIGIKHTEKWKRQISIATKGRKPTEKEILTLKKCTDAQSMQVGHYDLNGLLISKYKSLSEASRITGINVTAISRSINFPSKNPRKYIWKLI